MTAGRKLGSPAPTNVIVDIHGRTFDPCTIAQDWLVIYTAASKSNCQSLTKFMKKMDNSVKAKYPTLKCIFVSIADLKVVPQSMQSSVLPILKTMDASNINSSVNLFAKMIQNTYNAQDMYFHADWSGQAVQDTFGMDANESFRLMICNAGPKGTILAAIYNYTKESASEYLAGVDSAVHDFPEVLASWPTGKEKEPRYDNLKLIDRSSSLKIKSGKTSRLSFYLDQPSLVGWKLSVSGSAKSIEVCITKVNGDGSETPAVPRRKVECAKFSYSQVCHFDAGEYCLQFHNTSLVKSKDLTFEIHSSSLTKESDDDSQPLVTKVGFASSMPTALADFSRSTVLASARP